MRIVSSGVIVVFSIVTMCGLPGRGANKAPKDSVRTEQAQLLGEASVPEEHLSMWYRKPASIWLEALPIGNGRLGAMIFGGVVHEQLQLNEDTIWSGYEQNADNPKALETLPEIRRLIFEGKNNEAETLCTNLVGQPPRIKPYQPLGDLYLDTPNITAVNNYRRELNLETGVASVRYEINGATYSREVFASRPDNVIVMRLSCDKPGRISTALTLSRSQDAQSLNDPGDPARLILRGRIACLNEQNQEVGMRFESQVVALPVGGSIKNANGRLEINGADSVVLLVAGATDYRGGDPEALCREQLKKAAKPYDDLRSAHLADYQKLFQRVSLDLGSAGADVDKLPTDERLDRVKKGQIDLGLVSTYFQFGRYLLMSCSRPGGMPANLQGMWSWEMNPSWNCDYHTNINIQMNYWPAEVCNLAECQEPLFDLMDHLSKPGAVTARETYNCNGWVVHHLTDPFFRTAPADGVVGVWPMGAAWLAWHPYEHYLFSGDKEFLAKQGYPLMKGAALFIMDFLVEAPPGTPVAGKLVTCPSFSPENRFFLADGTECRLTYAATMDLEIINNLLTNCIEASKTLNIDPDFRAKCESTLQRLAPLQISQATGRIQEWVEDYKEQDPHHRHTSHLFALYPGHQISLQTPELLEAARKSLIARGDGGTGWSLAWKINFWARLQDGDHSFSLLTTLLQQKTCPNLFDLYPPFQIDANFGATAAIAEMLLQSQTGEVHLLPALPKAWADGSVHGLRARGGYEVDITWKGGSLTSATIHSSLAQTCHVRYGSKTCEIALSAGQTVKLNNALQVAK